MNLDLLSTSGASHKHDSESLDFQHFMYFQNLGNFKISLELYDKLIAFSFYNDRLNENLIYKMDFKTFINNNLSLMFLGWLKKVWSNVFDFSLRRPGSFFNKVL